MVSDRPNVLLILSDDHGYGDRSRISSDPAVRTPGLDRLAESGVTCPEAYVTAPICSPSRSAIISGRHQARWGAQWFESSRFPDHLPSMAERFAELGYATGYFGKVHYGPEQVGDRGCPPHHGFQTTYYGLAGQQQGRLNYLRHSQEAMAAYGPEASWRMAVQPMLEGDDPVELERFLTDELAERAGGFVAENSDRPFFCMLAFNAVHNFCWQLPPEELELRGLPVHADWHDRDGNYADWYDGAITPNLDHGRDYYLAQLELMDAAIGRLLDQLDEAGQDRNTIVVYLTDNGGSTCNYADNTPLAGTKYTLWEGGIRVPFVVRWPQGGWSGGVDRPGVVSSLDLFPTLLEAAGARTEITAASDGVDIGPLLSGATGGHDQLCWDCGFQWAIRDGGLKLRVVDGDSRGAVGIRRTEHAEPGSGVMLVDLVADPGETRNLVDERPDQVARLTAAFDAWRDRLAAEAAVG
ncbi:MAG: sulfatase-like hydrolase/transferase [Microlunatus sp.]|nr:sulfatase-like hydrolase/transferase [Microlunatus sp.]